VQDDLYNFNHYFWILEEKTKEGREKKKKKKKPFLNFNLYVETVLLFDSLVVGHILKNNNKKRFCYFFLVKFL
jgi:prophage maintenance system killer protein